MPTVRLQITAPVFVGSVGRNEGAEEFAERTNGRLRSMELSYGCWQKIIDLAKLNGYRGPEQTLSKAHAGEFLRALKHGVASMKKKDEATGRASAQFLSPGAYLRDYFQKAEHMGDLQDVMAILRADGRLEVFQE